MSTLVATFSNTELTYLIIAVIFVILAVFLVTAVLILRFIQTLHAKQLEENGIVVKEKKESAVTEVWELINDRVPAEKEADILLSHNYDGIQELDNHLPPWWKAMFYFGLVFGVCYLAAYHVFGTFDLQTAEYLAQSKEIDEIQQLAAAQEAANFDESAFVYEENATYIANGQKIFGVVCATCHGKKGEGLVGPNLADSYWKNGGDFQSVYGVIKNGVEGKAMPGWKGSYSIAQMRDIATYVISLEGSNPPGAKGPEGELFKRGSAAEASSDDTASL